MRFVLRFLGFILLVAGFVILVADGSQTIANDTLTFTPLGMLVKRVISTVDLIQVADICPYLWDPVLVNFLQMPAFLVIASLSLLLLWLGRRRPEAIGFET